MIVHKYKLHVTGDRATDGARCGFTGSHAATKDWLKVTCPDCIAEGGITAMQREAEVELRKAIRSLNRAHRLTRTIARADVTTEIVKAETDVAHCYSRLRLTKGGN